MSPDNSVHGTQTAVAPDQSARDDNEATGASSPSGTSAAGDAKVEDTYDEILLGAPVARHDHVHNVKPLDRPVSMGGMSLDAPSIASSSQEVQGPDDTEAVHQNPVQDAQLATEQHLEPDVRRISRPQRRRRRRVSRNCLAKYVCCRSSTATATPRSAVTRGSCFDCCKV